MKKPTEKELKKIREEIKKLTHREWKRDADIIKKIIKSKLLTKHEAKRLSGIFLNNVFSYRSGDLRYGDKLEKELKEEIEETEKKKKRGDVAGYIGIAFVVLMAIVMILRILGVI